MLKEVVVAYFKGIFGNIPGGMEDIIVITVTIFGVQWDIAKHVCEMQGRRNSATKSVFGGMGETIGLPSCVKNVRVGFE
jgi:hypothetical protein